MELSSLGLKDVRIVDILVHEHERMLSDGFYAEVTLTYDATIVEEKHGRPFAIESLRAIQLSKSDVLVTLTKGRERFTTSEWKDFLLRSVGMEPQSMSDRAKMVMLLRMIPFVERNYNLVELGPRGTGKSHLYQQISPYSHLISGGKATVAKMFVNMSSGQRGLVCLYDVVCFDEVSGISFDQKDGVNILKGYMAAGEFSRGKESIRASGGIVMVGNFDVDVEQQQRIGHLLSPLPPEMRNDTAFMDRIHAYAPGWDFPKLKADDHLTDHFGLGDRLPIRMLDEVARRDADIGAARPSALGRGTERSRYRSGQQDRQWLAQTAVPRSRMPIPDQELEAVAADRFGGAPEGEGAAEAVPQDGVP